MIEHILNALNTREEKDQTDYVTALAVFRDGITLGKKEVKKLVGLYEKYGRDAAHPGLAKLYLTLDMLPGRSKEDAVFSGFDLEKGDLDALFTAREIITQLAAKETLDKDALDAAVKAAVGGTLSRPVDIFLARVLLNDLAWRWDFGGFRKQAAELAGFLMEAGTGVMNEYAIFLEEAGRKCRS